MPRQRHGKANNVPEMNPGDYTDLVRRTRQVKDRVTQLTDDLGKAEATGLSDDGMVRAMVRGDGKLIALDLDPAVISPNDPGTLAALVMAAVNDAVDALNAQRASQYAPMTESVRDIIAQLRGTRETP
jgi:nucleoid-associated protein EbfC